MEGVAGNNARRSPIEEAGMLLVIEVLVAVGFLASVAVSIEAAAGRRESRRLR